MQSDEQHPPSIDENGVLLLFARVSAGAEKDLYANPHQLPGLAYKCFGPYDLLALRPYDTLKLPPVPNWAADDSPLSNPLAFPTFAWKVPGLLPIERQLDEGSGPFSSAILGVTFIKLNDAILERDGVRLESALAGFFLSTHFADWLAEHQKRAGVSDIRLPDDVAVLGSIGWHEIILLVGAAEAETVLRTWVALRQLHLADLPNYPAGQPIGEQPDDTVPVLKTTHTVVCLRGEEVLRILNDETDIPLGDVTANVCITCDAHEQVRIHRIARDPECFPEPTFTFDAVVGELDFVIRPKEPLPFSELTHRLLTFRRRLRAETAGLVSTETLLSTQFPLVNGETSPKTPPSDGVLLDERIEPAFTSTRGDNSPGTDAALQGPFYDPDTYARLKEAFDTLNWGLQDYRKASSLRGLRRFATSVSEYLGDKLEDPDIQNDIYQASELIRFASKCAELLKTGCDQSTLGIHPLDSSPVYAPGGGFQRLLVAASSISNQLLYHNGQTDWTGFMVSGIHGEAQRYHFGVVNVPREVLVNPYEWWQIVHEVGHEYSFVYSFQDSDGQDKRGFLNRPEIDEIVDSYPLNQGGQRLIWEILADMFVFQFGFRRHWDDYLTVVWRLLSRLRRMRDPQQQAAWLLRAAMVKAFSQLRDQDPPQISYHHLSRCRNEVLSRLEGFKPADPALLDKLLDDWNTEPFLRAFPIIVSAIREAEQLGFAAHADQPDSQTLDIDRGVPVHGLVDPLGLVIRLANDAARGEAQSFPSTIAAFLSLWDASVRNPPTPTTPEGVEGG